MTDQRFTAVLVEAGLPADEAARDAAALVAHAGGDDERAAALVAERAKGKPLGLLLGRVTFLEVPLEAGEGALAPRAETEILGRAALAILRGKVADHGRVRVIDMCTGAGNLACALAFHVREAEVWASDLTDGTVRLARRNVERLSLQDRVIVGQGDLFEPLAGAGLEGTVDVIVCNPPYISTGRLEKDRAALLDHEPREAFDGGPYGLSIHQRVIKEAPRFLRPEGWLLFEFGLGQHKQLALLFQRVKGWTDVSFEDDADGQPRVAKARWAPG